MARHAFVDVGWGRPCLLPSFRCSFDMHMLSSLCVRRFCVGSILLCSIELVMFDEDSRLFVQRAGT